MSISIEIRRMAVQQEFKHFNQHYTKELKKYFSSNGMIRLQQLLENGMIHFTFLNKSLIDFANHYDD